MLYNYDNALAKDLENSFNSSICVKVVDAEKGIDLAAQAENDEISFPLVLLTRYPDAPIDKNRYNFTRAHKGVATVIDKEKNELYFEKAIPVDLKYDLTILTTNTADRDELVKELIFKYTSMYFVSMDLPYESTRKIRFGVSVDVESEISNKSGVLDYLDSGTVYQSIIPLRCEGCVMLSYTPVKLKRSQLEVQPLYKGQEP